MPDQDYTTNCRGPPTPPPGRYDVPEDNGTTPPTPPGGENRQPQINRNAFNGFSNNVPPPSLSPDRPEKRNVPLPPGFDQPKSIDPRLNAVNRKQSTHSNNEYGRDDNDIWDGPPPPISNHYHGDNSAPADLDKGYGNQTEHSEPNANYNNRGLGGFKGLHGGHNHGYQDYGEHDGRGDSWNHANSRRGGIDAPRGGYDNAGGYGAPHQYAAPNDYYRDLPNNYNAPRGNGGGYNGHNRSYNAPRGGYNNPHDGYDYRQPQRYYPSKHQDNYRNPNNYHDDNGLGPPMSLNRQNSYENVGSNQPYPRNNFSRTSTNDVPLRTNDRFANTNRNTRPPSDFNNGYQGNGRPEVPNRALHDYLPQDRNVNRAGLERVKWDQWSDMELDPKIIDNLKLSGYTNPRKIQQDTIPWILQNNDIMCQGDIENGKVGAFLIPTIEKFLRDKESGAWKLNDRIYCLIVSPTYKQCMQLYDQAKKFTKNTDVRVQHAYEEVDVHENEKHFAKCDILIGCFGKLLRLMEHDELVTSDVKVLIIDDADRLFSHKYNSRFYEMFQYMSSRYERQTILFSTTVDNTDVENLIRQQMKEDYIEITGTISISCNRRSSTTHGRDAA